jgi:Tropinone reductase 1
VSAVAPAYALPMPPPIALVTGASKGIGAAIAHRLAADGHRVLRVARGACDGEHVQADVATEEGRDRIVETVAAVGRLDVLVHNVGTNVRQPTAEMAPETFEHIWGTNARPPFELARRLHPFLKAADGASVVHISSVAAARTVRTSSAAYAMSKGAVEALTRFLAVEWAPDGIRVNTVAPWYVRTPLVEEVLSNPDKLAAILERTPLRRIGEPEDVAEAVAFLCAARWVTGVWLPVDGGFMALGS